MRNGKEFINRVVKKMGYNPDQFAVVESGNLEEVDVAVFDDGIMTFITGSLTPNSEANDTVKHFHELDTCSVITANIDSGVSIIVSVASINEDTEGVNIQPLGIINSFLNQLINIGNQEATNEIVEEVETERISLKDYYRLCLPENKIGRKSDDTLIKELEEAGYKVK